MAALQIMQGVLIAGGMVARDETSLNVVLLVSIVFIMVVTTGLSIAFTAVFLRCGCYCIKCLFVLLCRW